jgi:hypothetical protein
LISSHINGTPSVTPKIWPNEVLPKQIGRHQPRRITWLSLYCASLGFIAYWAPTLAANSNRHRNRAAIGMLNLFLGWTFIGWVAALLWADTDNCEN